MSTVKLTMRRGQATNAVALTVGQPEAQTDTISLNIDASKIAKGDALLMVDVLKQAIVKASWPPISDGVTQTPMFQRDTFFQTPFFGVPA